MERPFFGVARETERVDLGVVAKVAGDARVAHQVVEVESARSHQNHGDHPARPAAPVLPSPQGILSLNIV